VPPSSKPSTEDSAQAIKKAPAFGRGEGRLVRQSLTQYTLPDLVQRSAFKVILKVGQEEGPFRRGDKQPVQLCICLFVEQGDRPCQHIWGHWLDPSDEGCKFLHRPDFRTEAGNITDGDVDEGEGVEGEGVGGCSGHDSFLALRFVGLAKYQPSV